VGGGSQPTLGAPAATFSRGAAGAFSGAASPARGLAGHRKGQGRTLSGALLKRWLGRLGPLLTADLDRALVTALGINMVPHREEGRREERARLKALHAAGGVDALVADLAS